MLPPTYGFEAARYALAHHTVDWNLIAQGALLDLVYCAVCVALFAYLFRKSRDSGQFAKNES
jgi:hypothetical protein